MAQHDVVHRDELWDAVDNLLYVFTAVETRVQDLTGNDCYMEVGS